VKPTTSKPWLAAHEAVIVLIACLVVAAFALAYKARVHDIVQLKGEIASDQGLVVVHAQSTAMVTKVFASVGDHVQKGAPILALDPNLSPDQLAQAETRLARQEEERKRLQHAQEVVNKVLASPEGVKQGTLGTLGIVGDTFNIINDLYTSKLKLDNANEYLKSSLVHQKNQVSSEIQLVQRNIDLLKRNLDVSKRETDARESALSTKRADFAALMKLAEKGLVPTTDVNRERDALLQAELALTQSHRAVDQVELDISNRSLHISELHVQAESLEEDAKNKFNAAQLDYDLRAARLAEHKAVIEHDLANIDSSLNDASAALEVGHGSKGMMALTATTTGTLTRLRFYAPGDTVKAGDHVATIQPDGTHPVVLAHLPNKDVASVHESQKARVLIDAYPYQRFGTAGATVDSVFASPTGPEFMVRLKLDRTHMGNKPDDTPLLPGLHVHVDLITEERRLIDLLVHP
jgi:hemolysin D